MSTPAWEYSFGAMAKGFGTLIAQRREAVGMTPEQLAHRLGRKSKSFVYRLEDETQEPDSETINMLVSVLPMSTEELLRGLGIWLPATAASKIPTRLLELLAAMSPEQQQAILQVVELLGTAPPTAPSPPRRSGTQKGDSGSQ